MSCFNGLKRTIGFLAATLPFAGCTQSPGKPAAQVATETPAVVTEWAHGFQTDYVKATRYSGRFGFTIGFEFPQHHNNCDSPEIHDWLTSHGGRVYQFGGYRGAEAIVGFKDVTDKESANAKLATLMPELTEFMKSVH